MSRSGPWTAVSSPLAPGTAVLGVFAYPNSDAWAVGGATGGGGAIARTTNSATWNVEQTEPTVGLSAIHGSGPSDLWAGSQSGGASGGTVFHFAGSTWLAVTNPALTSHSDWQDIFARTSTDAWGATGAGLLHWDGGTWGTRLAVPGGSNFTGVWASGPGDVWVTSIGATSLVHLTP